jgi:hypothetical protein
MAVTQRYVDLTGVSFAEEATQLGAVSSEPSTDLTAPRTLRPV